MDKVIVRTKVQGLKMVLSRYIFFKFTQKPQIDGRTVKELKETLGEYPDSSIVKINVYLDRDITSLSIIDSEDKQHQLGEILMLGQKIEEGT